MKKTLVRLFSGLIVCGLLFAPGTAVAQDGGADSAIENSDNPDAPLNDRINALKRRCVTAINVRLEALNRAERAVGHSRTVSDEHAKALTDIIVSNRAGLKDLRDKIKAADNRTEVVRLCKLIVTDHWIFRLVMPQVRLTLRADHYGAVADRIDAKLDKLAERIKAMIEDGIDVGDAPKLLEEAQGHIDKAHELTAGVPDAMLALTVDDVPTGKADEVKDQSRADLKDSAHNMRSAHRLIFEIIRILRAAVDPAT